MNVRISGDNDSDITSPVCPVKAVHCWPVSISHRALNDWISAVDEYEQTMSYRLMMWLFDCHREIDNTTDSRYGQVVRVIHEHCLRAFSTNKCYKCCRDRRMRHRIPMARMHMSSPMTNAMELHAPTAAHSRCIPSLSSYLICGVRVPYNQFAILRCRYEISRIARPMHCVDLCQVSAQCSSCSHLNSSNRFEICSYRSQCRIIRSFACFLNIRYHFILLFVIHTLIWLLSCSASWRNWSSSLIVSVDLLNSSGLSCINNDVPSITNAGNQCVTAVEIDQFNDLLLSILSR
jgi:hypothetical protein